MINDATLLQLTSVYGGRVWGTQSCPRSPATLSRGSTGLRSSILCTLGIPRQDQTPQGLEAPASLYPLAQACSKDLQGCASASKKDGAFCLSRCVLGSSGPIWKFGALPLYRACVCKHHCQKPAGHGLQSQKEDRHGSFTALPLLLHTREIPCKVFPYSPTWRKHLQAGISPLQVRASHVATYVDVYEVQSDYECFILCGRREMDMVDKPS